METPEVSIADMIECASREVKMRRRVYPRFVQQGRMRPEEAARELDRMEAILHKLQALEQASLL